MIAGWRRVLAVCVAAASARGQAAGVSAPETHGWIATRSLTGGGATLLHLPPRESGLGLRGVDVGVARSLRTLDKQPARVVADSRRVFLLYPDPSGRLDVYSIRVRPAGLSGHWLAEPVEGATAERSLALGEGGLVDAVAAEGELFVLVADELWRLWRLRAAGWEEVPMPPLTARPDRGWASLVAGSCSLTLIEAVDARVVRWSSQGGSGDNWSPELLSLAAPVDPQRLLSVFDCGGDVCLAARTEEGFEVLSLGPGVVGPIAGAALPGKPMAAVPLSGGMRIAVLDLLHDEGAQGVSKPIDSWGLVETSLATGRELYRGPPRAGMLALSNEIRWLSLGMMGLTAGVLFYLLKPQPSSPEPVLPQGFALASPGRRLLAAVVDAAVVVAPVCLVLGVPLSSVVLVLPLLETPSGVLALASIVALGSVSGALSEWLTCRTPGKWLAGCRVVSVDPGRARVGLARSLARNVFRWAFAPWALLGLGPPLMRHRGDLVAGAAVVVGIRGAGPDKGGAAGPPPRG